jgi:predicted kinase
MPKDTITKENKLIMLIGLPRSGKSTIARSMNIPIVDTDAIRKALGVFPFIPDSESVVWFIAKYMVKALFYAGHTEVVLDATNLTIDSRREWKSSLYTIVYFPVTTSEEECINRAKKTNQEYLIPVIKRMAQTIEWPTEFETTSDVI